jgi:YggT family protein
MNALVGLLFALIDLYRWVVIASAIVSWLSAFGVINRYNRGVAMIEDTLFRLTEPALRPIRRIVPDLGGVDISPVILLLLLWFLETLLADNLVPYVRGY